ncbi:MAG: hypothetical protein ACREA4_12430, partial [Nitrososphaera sp.]
IWVVGSNIQDGTILEYIVDSRGPASSLNSALVTMTFAEDGDNWNVTFDLKNRTSNEISETIVMSKELTREGGIDEALVPYFEPIQTSILAVRDMEYGDSPKYLVVGAPWNTIFVGPSSSTVRVTSEETVQTGAGSFDAFVLSYKLDDDISRIWMVDTMPLPVKAVTFDEADQPYYSFELLRASGVNSQAGPL